MKVEYVELQEANSNRKVITWRYRQYMNANIGRYFVFVVQVKTHKKLNAFLAKLLVVGMKL